MYSFIAQYTNYIELILLLIYLSMLAVKHPLRDVVQKVTLYMMHFFGYLCLWVHTNDIQLFGFYALQFLFLTLVLLIGDYVWKEANQILLRHILIFFVISMIVLTRISLANAFRQFTFWILGMGLLLLLPVFLKKKLLLAKIPLIYGMLGFLLLALVNIMGSISYGAKLHLSIGSVMIQPSEFVKILMILFLATALSKTDSIRTYLYASVVSAFLILCLVASKDLGGALLYFMIYICMLYAKMGKKRLFAFSGIALVAAAILGYQSFAHFRVRVFAWLMPLEDFYNKGYQICQSLFGIGSGSWMGFGICEGNPSLIPIVDKDFIFSAIAEEWGTFFGIGLIALVFCLFHTMIDIGKQAKHPTGSLICYGAASVYAMQSILTIGGAIKFIPSTGVTLPLVSYGGSSLVATLILFGLVMVISMNGWEAPLEETKTHERQIFLVFTAVFIAMAAYLIYFMVVERQFYLDSSYNPFTNPLY